MKSINTLKKLYLLTVVMAGEITVLYTSKLVVSSRIIVWLDKKNVGRWVKWVNYSIN